MTKQELISFLQEALVIEIRKEYPDYGEDYRIKVSLRLVGENDPFSEDYIEMLYD